jgi:hypothetical protein
MGDKIEDLKFVALPVALSFPGNSVSSGTSVRQWTQSYYEWNLQQSTGHPVGPSSESRPFQHWSSQDWHRYA